MLASAQSFPAQLVSDGRTVFGTALEGIYQVHLTTGELYLLAPMPEFETSGVASVALDPTRLFVVMDHSIVAIDKLTGERATLLTNTQEDPVLTGAAVDNDRLYFVSVDRQPCNATVLALPLAGGPPTALNAESVIGSYGHLTVQLDGDSVYVFGYIGWNDSLHVVPKAGGTLSPLFYSPRGQIYQGAQFEVENIQDQLTVTRLDLTTEVGRINVLAASAMTEGVSTNIGAIAVDESGVYWAESTAPIIPGSGGYGGAGVGRSVVSIRRAAFGKVTTLIDRQSSVSSIALDRYNHYWTNSANGTVMSLRKPGTKGLR